MPDLPHYFKDIITGRISIKRISKYFYHYYVNTKKFSNHPIVETIYGSKMHLNPEDEVVSKHLYIDKYYEYQETEYFKKIISKGMQVIDIGANIGYYSILFSKWVGNYGKVFAFEPDPLNYELLEKNIQANHCKNIISIKKAVSNSNEKISLFQSIKNPGDHRIFDANILPEDKFRKKVEIESIKLDSFFPPEQKIDLIKMDIQGSEMFALDGMTQLLSQNHKMFLFTEFWPYAIEKSGNSPKDFLEKLRQLGFKISSSIKDEKIPTSSHDFGEKECKSRYINLICEK